MCTGSDSELNTEFISKQLSREKQYNLHMKCKMRLSWWILLTSITSYINDLYKQVVIWEELLYSHLLAAVFYPIYFTFMNSGAVRSPSVRSFALCHFTTMVIIITTTRRTRLWNSTGNYCVQRLNLNPTLVCVLNILLLSRKQLTLYNMYF